MSGNIPKKTDLYSLGNTMLMKRCETRDNLGSELPGAKSVILERSSLGRQVKRTGAMIEHVPVK
jgi:hypothetical protein